MPELMSSLPMAGLDGTLRRSTRVARPRAPEDRLAARRRRHRRLRARRLGAALRRRRRSSTTPNANAARGRARCADAMGRGAARSGAAHRRALTRGAAQNGLLIARLTARLPSAAWPPALRCSVSAHRKAVGLPFVIRVRLVQSKADGRHADRRDDVGEAARARGAVDDVEIVVGQHQADHAAVVDDPRHAVVAAAQRRVEGRGQPRQQRRAVGVGEGRLLRQRVRRLPDVEHRRDDAPWRRRRRSG